MQSVGEFNNVPIDALAGWGDLTGHLDTPGEPAKAVSRRAHTLNPEYALQTDQAESQEGHAYGFRRTLDRRCARP